MPFFEKIFRPKLVDLPLVVPCVLLNIIGLSMLYSLTSGTSGDSRFIKQIAFTVLGLIVFFFISSINHQNIKGAIAPLYAAGILALLLVLIFGSTIRGTRAWFAFAGFSLQPFEFVKIILSVLLAQLYSSVRVQEHSLPWNSIIRGAVATGIPLGLVLLQPDFGSGLVVLSLFLGIILVRGVTWKKIGVLIVVAAILSTSGWLFFLQGYQKERILTFMGIQNDPYGIEYNVTQSIIAIGSGGVFGRGLGFGSQSQLRFLPESSTDFIFSSAAEELGMAGATVILGLFVMLFYRIIIIARESRDAFSSLLVIGIGILFFSHFIINIGTTLGLLPVAGVPLPFMSYGGSFLLASWIALGMIQGISWRNKIVHQVN